MIFVDTNILIDVMEAPPGSPSIWSNEQFRVAAATDVTVTNLIVVAELSAGLDRSDRLIATLASWAVEVVDLTVASANRAGMAFREYRRRGGARSTILPDFLIAAHAETLGAQLMTRDKRLASYFPNLTFLTPESEHG